MNNKTTYSLLACVIILITVYSGSARNWVISLDSNPYTYYKKIKSIDTSSFILIEGTSDIYKNRLRFTSDAGVSWRYIFDENTASQISLPKCRFNDFACYDDNSCVVVGSEGIILKSDNNFENWEILNFPENINIQNIWIKYGFAFLKSGFNLYFTLDIKKGWNGPIDLSPGQEKYEVKDLAILENRNVIIYAFGKIDDILEGNILYSVDTCKSFIRYPAKLFGRQMEFTSNNIGYLVGTVDQAIDENYGEQFVDKTIDGGKTWFHVLDFIDTMNIYYYLDFFDDNNGVIAGISPVMLFTSDGGKTWVGDTLGTLGSYISSIAYSTKDNIILRNNEKVYRNDNSSYISGDNYENNLYIRIENDFLIIEDDLIIDKLCIYDIMGNCMLMKNDIRGNPYKRYNINGLSVGFYIIVLYSDGKIFSKSFIKY